MENRPLTKRIKYSLIYYFVRFLIFCSGIIPRSLWLSFCGLLGRIAWNFSTGSRSRAITHLQIAFPEKSGREIVAISKRMYTMLGKNAGDILRSRNVTSTEGLNKFIKVQGFEHFERASALGKGVIFLTSHLGAFDLQVTVMAMRGLKPNIIGTALKDERLNDLLFNYRNAHGAVAIERGKETLRMIRALRKGGMVAILIDQDTRVKSRFVNVFGKPAATPVGASILALKTGAAVVPTSIYLGEDGWQHMTIFPALPLLQSGDDEQDMISNTQAYTTFLESEIRQHPEQWVWMHERWKTKRGEEVS